MCGITGFVNLGKGKLWNTDNILPELMFASQLRGRDAVGMFGVDRDTPNFVNFVKATGGADTFLQWAEPHKKIIRPSENFRFVVAHNRAATVGNKDDVNAAHPHVTSNIILVHNGTLSHYPGKDQHVSDSSAIATLLEENPDFKEVEKQLFGAWALVWYDKRTKTLNFVRNSSRPLGFVTTADNGLWFASEPLMLQWILTRKRKEIKDVFELKERLWVSIGEDNRVKEVNVPWSSSFTTGESGTPSSEADILSGKEFLEDPELLRAFETINGGAKKIKTWEQMEFIEQTEVAPRPLAPSYYGNPKWNRQSSSHGLGPTESSIQIPSQRNDERNSGNSSTREETRKSQFRVLSDGYMGISVGDKVFFYPIAIRSANSDKHRTICTGPFMAWGQRGEVNFINGVEVHSRLVGLFDDDLQPDKIYQLSLKRQLHEAEVTAITYDTVKNRVVFHAKDSTPQDWACIDDIGIEMKQIEYAYTRPLSSAAPEVAAEEEKKSEQAA
jgi:hypothetical protein